MYLPFKMILFIKYQYFNVFNVECGFIFSKVCFYFAVEKVLYYLIKYF